MISQRRLKALTDHVALFQRLYPNTVCTVEPDGTVIYEKHGADQRMKWALLGPWRESWTGPTHDEYSTILEVPDRGVVRSGGQWKGYRVWVCLPYSAEIMEGGELRSIGEHDTPEEAMRAVEDALAKEGAS